MDNFVAPKLLSQIRRRLWRDAVPTLLSGTYDGNQLPRIGQKLSMIEGPIGQCMLREERALITEIVRSIHLKDSLPP
jgi:hypothetical protein